LIGQRLRIEQLEQAVLERVGEEMVPARVVMTVPAEERDAAGDEVIEGVGDLVIRLWR